MRVLIIVENHHFAKSIFEYLIHEDYMCEMVYTLSDGKYKIQDANYDCIIIDNSNFVDNGVAFLKEMKIEKRKESFIIIGKRNLTKDITTLLKLGADDYLVKPIDLSELSARIESVLRRKYYTNAEEIQYKNLTINTSSRSVFIGSDIISLTRSEYDLLLLLVINKGRVIKKEEIAQRLSGQSAIYLYNFDIVYTHIKNIKKKLSGITITTVYGNGYLLTD